jgi:hypothetical protein
LFDRLYAPDRAAGRQAVSRRNRQIAPAAKIVVQH